MFGVLTDLQVCGITLVASVPQSITSLKCEPEIALDMEPRGDPAENHKDKLANPWSRNPLPELHPKGPQYIHGVFRLSILGIGVMVLGIDTVYLGT